MRFDADHLTARFGNMARSRERFHARSERQKAEMGAVAAVLRGDHYAWLTPSMFDPDAQRLRDKYPAAGTTRIKWRMDDETTLRVTGDMRTSDFEIGYTKNDHLSYAYGGVGDRYRKRHDGPTYSGKMSDMLKQLPTPEEVERQAQAWRDAYPHARIIGDEIDLTLSPEDTLAEEIKADAERAAELAAKTPPGFIQYEEAKKQGLVDEDPWPTTEEILAAHAAKHYADGLREDAERDLARIEARNAFKAALRKSAITASLIMIGGVAVCFAVGLIGALIYSAFNFFAPRLEGSETAATVGFYAIFILFGLLFGTLVGTSTRR